MIGEQLRGLAAPVAAVVDVAQAPDVVVGDLVRVQPEFFGFFVGRQFVSRLESQIRTKMSAAVGPRTAASIYLCYCSSVVAVMDCSVEGQRK